jgi:hypothetical protein
MDFMKEIFQQRFSSQCDYLANSTFAAYHIEDASGKILYSETSANKTPIKRLERSFAFAGKAYLDDKDSLINTARTFENSNFVSLEDAHQLLVRLALSENDFSFFSRIYWDSLFSYMCNLPATDSTKGIYPSTFKYLYYGSDLAVRNSVVLDFSKTSRDLFKMYNKVGQAYGFLSDVAYFESEDKKTKFVLAASVFVDRDGVLNDGKYAYDEIGFPFFAELGKRIFLSEYKRTHKK